MPSRAAFETQTFNTYSYSINTPGHRVAHSQLSKTYMNSLGYIINIIVNVQLRERVGTAVSVKRRTDIQPPWMIIIMMMSEPNIQNNALYPCTPPPSVAYINLHQKMAYSQ